jgi:UDP-N-acetylenolpyruvoylglucosamine reductase
MPIISACLILEDKHPDDIKADIRKRVEFIKSTQDRSKPNLGTIFSENYCPHSSLLDLKVNDCVLSAKTPNWILNNGNATSADFISLVNMIKENHIKRSLPEPKLEVVIA